MRKIGLLLILALSIGCPKSESSKDDDKSEKSDKSSKKKKGGDDDEISDEDFCKKLGKLFKKDKPDDYDEEKFTKQCLKKAGNEPERKKCAVKCIDDAESMKDFDKCDKENCKDAGKKKKKSDDDE